MQFGQCPNIHGFFLGGASLSGWDWMDISVIKAKEVETVKEVKTVMASDVSPVAMFLYSKQEFVGQFCNSFSQNEVGEVKRQTKHI